LLFINDNTLTRGGETERMKGVLVMPVRNSQIYQQLREKEYRALRCPFPETLAYRDASLSVYARTALRLKLALELERPVILPGQRLAFLRTVENAPDVLSESEMATLKETHFIHELGRVSNLCADYGRVLAEGLEPARILATRRLEQDASGEQGEFLRAAVTGIEAVYALCDRYKAEADAQNRPDIAQTLERVPKNGARTFREALQLLRILQFAVWCEGVYHVTLGRFDQYMYPYLKADLDAGRLTVPEEESLLEEYFISCNWDSDLYPGVQQGDNGQSLMLGGVDKNGNDAYNPLSEMCLKASRYLVLIDPKINLRVDKNTPVERYILATELTKEGLGFPQYSNDDRVIPAMLDWGYAPDDARNYSVAACWEFRLYSRFSG
jgi:formate C-acetyltransferase